MKIRKKCLLPTLAVLVAVVAGAQRWHDNPNAILIGQARAADEAPQETSVEQYCRHWARNGVMGAKVHDRNGPRKITYIDENELRYLLKHQVAGDNLYLLKGDYTPEEKRYLEESLLAGYDRLGLWIREHSGKSPDLDTWEDILYGDCMMDVPQAIQALRAKG